MLNCFTVETAAGNAAQPGGMKQGRKGENRIAARGRIEYPALAAHFDDLTGNSNPRPK
jgi:hypothetical protein